MPEKNEKRPESKNGQKFMNIVWKFVFQFNKCWIQNVQVKPNFPSRFKTLIFETEARSHNWKFAPFLEPTSV